MIKLSDFPRPPSDNGRGIHWSMSPYWDSQGKQRWAYWAEQLKLMGIKWVKVIDDGGGSSLRLVNRLVDLEIVPVVRFYWPEQNSADHQSGILGSRGADAAQTLIDAGAVYFEVNNEPDLALEWKDRKRPDNWLEIVIRNFIADADIILNKGGYPAVPAFGVGTLRNPFELIVDSGRGDILDNGCWAGVHNYGLGRPLDYPNDPVNMYGQELTREEYDAAGGFPVWEISLEEVNRARERDKNPEATILTDATCFRAFEQLNDYIVQAVGHSIPIMMTEGGYNVEQRGGTYEGDDPRYPKPTPQRVSELTMQMFAFTEGSLELDGKLVPEYYFASMPWLIANYKMHVYQPPAECQGPWFTDFFNEKYKLHGELPVVQMLKDTPPNVRADGPVPEIWKTTRESDGLGTRWDQRLNYLGITYKPGTEWKLDFIRWQDEEESGGKTSIFVKVLDESGNPIPNHPFMIERQGAIDVVETKDAADGYWGNYTMYGSIGTYTVYITDAGDKVVGLGYGVEVPPHNPAPTSFFLTFRKSYNKFLLTEVRRSILTLKTLLESFTEEPWNC